MTRIRSLFLLHLFIACLLPMITTAHVCGEDAKPAAFDFRKEALALRDSIEQVRGVLSQAVSSGVVAEKKAALEKFQTVKDQVQAFTDRALKNGKDEDAVTDYLERFKFADCAKMERDLRAAINEAAAAGGGQDVK